MSQIQLSSSAKQILSNSISSDNLLECFSKLLSTEKEGFLRYFLLEGSPSIFNKEPLKFEVVKDWMSSRFNLHPKEIFLLGSAKAGYSLKPVKFGTLFGASSDLDFAFVSENLFNSVKIEFFKWVDDFQSGLILPRNDNEKKYWPENVKTVKATLSKGFIDANKIPNRYAYPINQNINNQLYNLKVILENSEPKYKVKKANARIYQTLQKLTERLSLNFSVIVNKIEKQNLIGNPSN